MSTDHTPVLPWLAGVRRGGHGSGPPCHAATSGSQLDKPLAKGKAR